MRIPSGSTDKKLAFVAVDATDLKTRETGLTGFTVYRSRNGGTATVYTTPTVAELDATNMPGVYVLTVDEDTTLGAGVDEEEYVVHITQASMAPVTRAVELFRVKITQGETVTAANGAADADIERLQGSAIATPTVAGVLEADVTHWLGTAAATPTVAGVPEVDVTHFGGVAGTFAGGRPEVNTSHWRGTAAAAPTVAGVPAVEAIDISAAGQTDIRSAVGLAAANLDTQLDALPTALENADAIWDEDATAHQTQGTFGQAIGDPVADASTIWGLANTNLDALVSSRLAPTVAGRTLDVAAGGEAGLDLDNTVGALAKGTEITGFNDLDAAGVRGAVGLAAANLDTQLSTIDDFLDTEVLAIKAKTDNLPANPAAATDAGDALDLILADSIPADGTRPSVRQALYMLTQFLCERAVSGTTVTVKKVDGSTTLLTLTLDSATTPTSITRAT
jgi:hypothetical protein